MRGIGACLALPSTWLSTPKTETSPPIAGSTQVVAFRLGYESLKNFKKELEVNSALLFRFRYERPEAAACLLGTKLSASLWERSLRSFKLTTSFQKASCSWDAVAKSE